MTITNWWPPPGTVRGPDWRILVTGSRSWTDAERIRGALVEASGVLTAPRHPHDVIVVHGGALGADRICEAQAYELGFRTERHLANWNANGSAAGMIRNQRMVDLGADVCRAFIAPCEKRTCAGKGLHGSHGATYCANLAEMAVIETVRLYQ